MGAATHRAPLTSANCHAAMPDAPGPWLASTISRRVAAASMVAGFIGAADVFLLLWFVLPSPGHPSASDSTLFAVNAAAFVILMAATGPLNRWWGARWFRPVRSWVSEERAPTASERNATLAIPLRCSIMNATAWLAAAVVFFAINAPFSVALAGHVSEVILIGGLTCVALGYLLTERIVRPLTARALAYGPVAPRRPGVKGRLVLTWLCASGVPMIGLIGLGAGVLENPEGVTLQQMSWSVVAVAAVGFMAGLLGTALVSKSVAEPLGAMRKAMGMIEEGDLTARVQVDDGSEVGLLQSRFNAMAAGLEERERLRDLFGRHVGEDVVRSALDADGDGPALGGEVRDVGVLFADLVGSTALAAERPPDEVVRLLNEFFQLVVEVTARHGGWVNKFEGDAALVVFGAPTDHPDAAGAALRAARELHERMDGFPLRAGVGISFGPAVAGNVGAEERFEYTVIGDTVNEAARLCELAKRRDDCVLASAAAVRSARNGERHRWLEGDEVVLRGRSQPTRIAAPVGVRDRVG